MIGNFLVSQDYSSDRMRQPGGVVYSPAPRRSGGFN
jgi:hypothetical protein